MNRHIPVKLVDAVSQAVTGEWVPMLPPPVSIQATIAGAGAVSATVAIEVSNDGVNPIPLITSPLSLSGSLAASDGFVAAVHWRVIRAKITSPVGGAVTVIQNSY